VLAPPIIERELRAALHKRGALKSRFRMAGWGVLVVSLFMLVGMFLDPGTWGGTLHFILFIWGLVVVVQPALTISAGLFSEERRDRTLDLLYLTGMTSGELFIGKLLGAALVASCDLLALFPLMAVPFLSGGISLDLFLATIVCLPTVFLFLLTAGLLASVICRDDGAALVLAATLVGVISLAVPLPYWMGRLLTGAAPFSYSWLCLSPAFGPYIVWRNLASFTPGDFWVATAATLGWSALGIGLAAVQLRRNWRRDIEGTAPSDWRAKWEALVHGSERWRSELRARLLPENPFQWLAEQDRRSVLLAWVSLLGICLLWLLGWVTWRGYWLSPLNLYSTALLLLLAAGVLRSYAAARRIGEDRRDGMLELVLTTPLTPAQIVEGQVAASKDQFRPVRYALLGILVVMMVGGLFGRHWNWQAILTYLLVWLFFFRWCWQDGRRSVPRVMWIALNSGRPAFAAFGSSRNLGYSLFWQLFNLRNIMRGGLGSGLAGFPRGNQTELIFMIIGGVILGFVWALRRSMENLEFPRGLMQSQLIAEMRSIAQDPVPDPKDPRWKKWKDMTERFPAPRPFENLILKP
jgi:ABC-type Na+ efflux pump permease subunit